MKYTYRQYNANYLSAADFNRIMPRRVYKYRSANEFFFELLKTNSLWFSRHTDFNDPFDCRLDLNLGNTRKELQENLQLIPGLSVMKNKELQDVHKKLTIRPGFYNSFINQVLQLVLYEKRSICCFAEAPDNVLLWSHYAASHTGVCLEFDLPRKGFLYSNLLPVQYKDDYPVLNLSDFRTEKRSLFTLYQQAVCSKSSIWEYEQEWRAVLDNEAGSYSFDKKDLRKIIFGVNTNKDIRQKTKALLQQYGYKDTKLYSCRLLKGKFALKVERVPDSL